MKKVSFIAVALFMFVHLGFSQAKYQAKIVVLFMGEKNSTFDESKFPNCKFYYTPGIKGIEEKVESVASKGFGALGIKGTESDYKVTYSGTPEEAYKTKICEAVLFDVNGYVSGLYKSFDNVSVSPKRNMQGTSTFVPYNSISKDYIKKGDETKKAKKAPKKPKHLFDYYGMTFPYDFEVENAQGEKTMITDLVKGEALTLFYALYLSPETDLKAGMESGEGKDSKEYINASINTAKGIKKLEFLKSLEKDIYGHTVQF